MQKLHKIYQTFLEYPYMNACLVFDDHEFQGVLLKKDLERKLCEEDNCILEQIIKVPLENLEDIIFNDKPSLKMKIPYISTQGRLLGTLLYEEFVSEFFPEDFVTKLSFREIFNYYEYPLIILNRFKTILYMNNLGQELLSHKAFGTKISDVLLAFTIDTEQDLITVTRQKESWQLLISKSTSPHAHYYIYQFIPHPMTKLSFHESQSPS